MSNEKGQLAEAALAARQLELALLGAAGLDTAAAASNTDGRPSARGGYSRPSMDIGGQISMRRRPLRLPGAHRRRGRW